WATVRHRRDVRASAAAICEAELVAARLARARGRPQDALPHYAQALAVGCEDPIAVEIGILDALDASRDTERARDRLEALLAREDLGDHLATLRIRQAQLGVDLDREERDALIDEALALDAAARAAGKGARLSAADRAWGEV